MPAEESAAEGGSIASRRRGSSRRSSAGGTSKAAKRDACGAQTQSKKRRRFDDDEAERVRRADPATIKNKARSSKVRAKKRQLRQQHRQEKKKERRRREARGETLEKEAPRTIESMRRPDDSVGERDSIPQGAPERRWLRLAQSAWKFERKSQVCLNSVKEGDMEVAAAEAADEFASIFRGERTPKLMITSSKSVCVLPPPVYRLVVEDVSFLFS